MSKTVILAEKPSQAQAYAEAFSKSERKDGYYVVSNHEFKNAVITYGFGHLVSLYNPNEYDKKLKSWSLDTLPILPDPFKFKVGKGKNKQYKIVKKHLDQADTIVIATDGDREGEAIARLIINLSGNHQKPLKRLWINSLEKEEVQKGFSNLRNGEEFYSSFKEAETRQMADWLVGMNLSRLYTLYMQQNGMQGVFSIGRVQTPTLYLIYQRNKEIEAFISKPFYELFGNFTHEKGSYQGKYTKRFESPEELTIFREEHQLDESKGVIDEVTTEEKSIQAPRLFSLSDLQSTANKNYGYSPAETLKIMQTLYEKKVLSYPRTDSHYIGSPEFEYLKNNLSAYLSMVREEIEHPQLTENKRYVNGKKVQEHYAIIPTRTLPDLSKLAVKERKMYELVLYRTLAIFEKAYVYDKTTIITKVNTIDFKTTGKIEKELGWKRLIKEDHKKEDTPLPNVLKDERVESKLEVKKGKTTPPKYYTEGTLITAMKNVGRSQEEDADKEILRETEGIGTEATRANVIETLKHQEYINIQKKNILVIEKGKTLCTTIKDNEITNANMTAKWERYLKKIRNGKGTQEAFLKSITNFINHLIETAPATFQNSEIKAQVQKINKQNKIGTCPLCQKDIVDKGKFYGCSGYHKTGCKFTLPKQWSKKRLTKKNINDLITKQETALIKGFRSKKGNPFNAKLKLNNNKLEFVFDKK
ncbi:MAG: DNA topoisomerase 3 [Lactococcus lactis]|nr:DNA topoisomerase 3 [Lactococcus lactis]